MRFDTDEQYVARGAAADRAEIDQGLRAHMLRVYNIMCLGLVVTGLVAYGVFTMAVADTGAGQLMLTEFGQTLYNSPLQWVVMLLPLAFVLVLTFGINRLSYGAAQAVFWLFAAAMGLSLSSIFLVYAGGSIAKVFFITAAAFAGLSLWGYTTKKDLSGFGTFLFMGLIGIVIAMVVNIFLQSSALEFIISVVGVLVFAGLTAYDTQKIKEMYHAGDGTAVAGKKALYGALSLYLDFINMFLFLLQLFGTSRE